LNKVYELIIFTAGTQYYADPILNIIEKKHIPILLEIAKNKENDVKIELKKFKNEIFTKITTNLKNEDNFLS